MKHPSTWQGEGSDYDYKIEESPVDNVLYGQVPCGPTSSRGQQVKPECPVIELLSSGLPRNDSDHLGELVPSWKVDDPELHSKSNHNPQQLYIKGSMKEILNTLRIQEKHSKNETFFYITLIKGVNTNPLIFRKHYTNRTLSSLTADASSWQGC